MFEQNREKLREFYFAVWNKHHTKQALEPIEQHILAVMIEHPEYHFIFQNPDKYKDKDFSVDAGEVNPFMHFGFHLGLQEQVATDRPTGIKVIYQKLLRQLGSAHEAEHQMMEVLAEMMLIGQREQKMPEEKVYLEALTKLVSI